jgi:hypothetical protein
MRPMTTPNEPPATFRRKSTRAYRAFVVVLMVVALGLLALGWWIGGWWGLLVAAVVAVVVVVGGLVAGTLIWAMTQDGA